MSVQITSGFITICHDEYDVLDVDGLVVGKALLRTVIEHVTARRSCFSFHDLNGKDLLAGTYTLRQVATKITRM